MVLLSVTAAVFVAAACGWRYLEKQRADALSASAALDQTRFAEKVVELRGQSLATLSHDCAQSSELAQFISAPAPPWARENLAPMLASYDATNMWVYDRQLRTAYTGAVRSSRDLAELPVDPANLRAQLDAGKPCHFFATTRYGLLELRGAAVRPPHASPAGYVFVGRTWDGAYLSGLRQLTGCSVALLAAGARPPAADAADSAVGTLSFSLTLFDWRGVPLQRAHFTGQTANIAQLDSAADRAITLFLVFPLLLLAIMSGCLLRWVTRPLRVMSDCMRTHEPALVDGLKADRTEFGELAALVQSFFQQKAELVAEVAERRRTQEELLAARTELEQRVQERTTALADANRELEQKIAERKQSEEEIRGLNVQLEHRLQRIAALRQIDVAITASLDLRLTLGILLDQILSQLRVDAASFLLGNPHSQTLQYAAGKGFRTPRAFGHVRLGEGHAGMAAIERRTYNIADLRQELEDFAHSTFLEEEGFIAYFAVPLVAKGRVKGVLEIYHRAELDPDVEWLDFLETLAGQAAIAIDNASLFDELQASNMELTQAYDATIEGWSRALDLRDKETDGHSQRVTDMTLMLARAMGVSENDLVHVRRGALLHDIGKMGIPDAILLKPGPLTDEEWVIMRKHPTYAYEMLSPVAFLRPALDVPYCHHEKWDGNGYPRGLKGEQIPLAARIFAVVDVWDALRFDRPYRKGWPDQKVYDHIRSLAGTHFDPAVVGLFLEVVPKEAPRFTGEEEAAA